MVKVQCIKCSREGSLTKKQTKSKGITYVYWYVEHHIGNKIKWCYLGKYEKLPDAYKKLIHKDTQTDTQNIPTRKHITNNLKLSPNQQKKLQRHFVHSQRCFQNEASSELNRLFQTTQQNHPALLGFVKNVVAHFFS